MRQFIIKSLNLLLIVLVLISYQKYAVARAELVAAHEAEEKEAKALEKEYAKMVADAEEAAMSPKDGVWEATGQGFGGDITLQVTIENHEIISVEVISAVDEDPEYLSMAKSLLSEIVDAQSADDLDTVSGATFSSQGILDAASQALEDAE